MAVLFVPTCPLLVNLLPLTFWSAWPMTQVEGNPWRAVVDVEAHTLAISPAAACLALSAWQQAVWPCDLELRSSGSEAQRQDFAGARAQGRASGVWPVRPVRPGRAKQKGRRNWTDRLPGSRSGQARRRLRSHRAAQEQHNAQAANSRAPSKEALHRRHSLRAATMMTHSIQRRRSTQQILGKR